MHALDHTICAVLSSYRVAVPQLDLLAGLNLGLVAASEEVHGLLLLVVDDLQVVRGRVAVGFRSCDIAVFRIAFAGSQGKGGVFAGVFLVCQIEVKALDCARSGVAPARSQPEARLVGRLRCGLRCQTQRYSEQETGSHLLMRTPWGASLPGCDE